MRDWGRGGGGGEGGGVRWREGGTRVVVARGDGVRWWWWWRNMRFVGRDEVVVGTQDLGNGAGGGGEEVK